MIAVQKQRSLHQLLPSRTINPQHPKQRKSNPPPSQAFVMPIMSLNLPKEQSALVSFAGGHGLSAVKKIPVMLDGKSEDGQLPENEVRLACQPGSSA